MFAIVFKCFSGFFTSVWNTCFKYFIYFLLYIATVASRCFKSRSRCCIWDARGKRPAAQTTSGVAWAHCWCARSLPMRAASRKSRKEYCMLQRLKPCTPTRLNQRPEHYWGISVLITMSIPASCIISAYSIIIWSGSACTWMGRCGDTLTGEWTRMQADMHITFLRSKFKSLGVYLLKKQTFF